MNMVRVSERPLRTEPGVYTIALPEPHDKQRLILRSKAKRKVICAGRRAGKTTLAAEVALAKLLEGRRVLLSSTTQDQADAFWDKCVTWCGEAIRAGIIVKNETRRTLRIVGRPGRIKVKTAWNADTLRGDYADFLVLDECAYLEEEAWTQVAAPMLLDNDGDAWFISTPKRRNWFYKLYMRAKADDTGRWEHFQFTSHDNPHLSKEALAEITGEMSEEDYRQEILAEFLEGEGAVFRNIEANLTAPIGEPPWKHREHTVYMGADWGQVDDYTCFSVACADCLQELHLERMRRMRWKAMRDRFVSLYDEWSVDEAHVEANSIGSVNIEDIEDLEDLGISIVRFNTNHKTKGPLIKGLGLAFERQEKRWLPIPWATAELEAFEAKVNAQTYSATYSAPDNMHDDSVIARALVNRAINLGLGIDTRAGEALVNHTGR